MKWNRFRWIAAAVLFAASAMRVSADVTVARIFGDDMILQRDRPVPVWGWADPGETATVAIAGQEKSAVAGENGKWMVKLDPMKASKAPAVLKVSGKNGITFKNVLVGEVWLCSGQSNMEVTLGQLPEFNGEIAAATNVVIRHRDIPNVESPTPLDDVAAGPWVVCASVQSVGRVTAVGYFFARELARELDVPVGLINSSSGWMPVESWIAPAGFEAVAELKYLIPQYQIWDVNTELGQKAYGDYFARCNAWLERAEKAFAGKQPVPLAPAHFPSWADPFTPMPTRIFNGMIHPLIPYALRGALWYEGVTHRDEGASYLHKTKALVGGWRQIWGQGDFPFYFVQMPAFGKSDPNRPAGGDGFAPLREAQRRALAAIPNTGMAVLIDGDEPQNRHPKNKREEGARLARWALAKDYGKPLVHSGPLYRSSAVEGQTIRLSFDSVGSGLMVGRKAGREPVVEAKGGKLTWFAIAGEVNEKTVWHWAQAVIEGDIVVVSSERVTRPVAVRYAYAGNPEGANLYNKEGLPASPFRTDE
jgi:sialate O-acetylesterase